MQRSLSTGVLAAALIAPSLSMAETTDAEMASMRAELAAMRAELTQLKGQDAAPAQATRDLQAATTAALEDARSRINYQAEELVAGHDGKKFFLSDAEGNFLMNVGGQIQFRYIVNQRENSTGDNGQQGFQMRRFKLKGDGHIGDPKIGFKYSVEFNRDTNAALVEEAEMSYKFDNGVKVVGGRYKGPFSFDELMSSSRQVAVERSLVNEQFTTGKMEGVGVELKPMDELKIRAMLSDGANGGEGGNGDFNESSADWAVTARADYTIGADNAKDYTSWSGDEMGLNIGGAVHYEVGQTGDGQTAATLDSFTRFTVDALYNCAGLSLAGAAYFEMQDAPDGVAESDPFGFLAQAAYNIDDQIEPFVRYEYIDTDVAGSSDISVITVGANYYLKKHAAKFTVDCVYALDPLNGIGVSDGLGLQTDAANEDGQYAVRAQFQLLF